MRKIFGYTLVENDGSIGVVRGTCHSLRAPSPSKKSWLSLWLDPPTVLFYSGKQLNPEPDINTVERRTAVPDTCCWIHLISVVVNHLHQDSRGIVRRHIVVNQDYLHHTNRDHLRLSRTILKIN